MKRTGVGSYLFGCLALLLAAAVVGITVHFRDAGPVLLDVPREAAGRVEQLMDAVCDGDFQEAEKLLYGGPDLGADGFPDDPVAAMIWQAYLETLDYRLEGELYVTRSGLAQDVKLISMELDTVTRNLADRARMLLEQRTETAENVSDLYDENNEYREDVIGKILEEAALQALEEDRLYTYDIITLPLVYSDGQWWVEAAEGSGNILEKYETRITNVLSDALEGIMAIDKVYWLQDGDLVAPKPNPDNYGETDDPKALEPVIRSAAKLMDGQETIFDPNGGIAKESVVTYYLDETILCITWQHEHNGAVYTCSEVKIAHPSQFRRFLSGGSFGSGKLYKATEMAADVNAVTASNGDYYAYRGYGNLVYNGEVKMAGNTYLDTCYVDSNGDLILKDYGPLYRKKDVEAFVEDNGIRFSLAFGPILVEDGKVVAKYEYTLGEADGFYSRAALCQIGPLHYMLVTVNRRGQDMTQFASHLKELGVDKAYALDGGQTSTIVTGNKLMNPVDYGGERETSDIIYFATAVPEVD